MRNADNSNDDNSEVLGSMAIGWIMSIGLGLIVWGLEYSFLTALGAVLLSWPLISVLWLLMVSTRRR
jgi:hypothetical protein